VDLEPRREAGELEVAAQIRQLLDLCPQYGRLRDVLFAAAHRVAGFGEIAAGGPPSPLDTLIFLLLGCRLIGEQQQKNAFVIL
jgi:hypothetical protein